MSSVGAMIGKITMGTQNDEMNKKELDEYYKWFLDQIPLRINILERVIKSTFGFENWKADYSPGSLDKLGEWFEKNVETRLRTDEEKNQMRIGLSWPANQLPVSDWELSDKTYSLAIDIGMYFSQVLLTNIPGLKWEHKTRGSRRWIDYGQPILAGFGQELFNPVQMIIVLAYGYVDDTWKGNRLRQLYDIWRKKVTQ